MNITFDELKKLKDAAALRRELDLVVKNVQLVNTATLEIHTVNLGIIDGIIVSFSAEKGKEVIDAKGLYAAPLLIDCHMHIESTLLTPANLNNQLLPRGIGTLIADPHEIANVAGKDGIQYILDAVDNLDLDIRVALPSCVPCTGFEHSGAILKSADLVEFYDNEHVIGLAEVMDYFAVLDEDDMLKKVHDARKNNRTIDGHGSILDAVGMDVFATIGIRNDHECVTVDGVLERMRRGIYTYIREGTITKNLKELLPAINELNYRYACFCTDDNHPDDIATRGGVDAVVRLAISEGLNPIQAITMATLNAAECYQLKDRGALLPGKIADFFLFEDLNNMHAKKVFRKGKLVAENGAVLNPKVNISRNLSSRITNSINVKEIQLTDLRIDLGESRSMKMIGVKPGNVLTDLIIEDVEKDEHNMFVANSEKNHAKLVVIERHHATGNIGKCAVKGFGLTKGAIATTVAHDSHNIICIGMSDNDIFKAVEALKEMQGGYVLVVDGVVKAQVPLEIAGLMTEKDVSVAREALKDFHISAGEIMTHKDFNPLLMLSFISLPVIPAVKLTDMGLVDVWTGTFLDVRGDH